MQVALRFPGCNDALVVSGAAMKDAVGGTSWHTDGLRQVMMVVVLLLLLLLLLVLLLLLAAVLLGLLVLLARLLRSAAAADHTDGLRQGKKHSFSLLVGVALSDNCVANRGNLCVWPGSHHVIHPLMRSPDGAVRRANGGYSDSDGPLPDLGAPAQLQLSAGDVVLAHSEVQTPSTALV